MKKFRLLLIIICSSVNLMENSIMSVMSLTMVVMVPDKLSVNDTLPSTITSNYEFDWTPTTVGIVLGSFSYGGMITHAFGGQIAGYFGSRNTIFVILFGSAILSLLTPISAALGVGYLIAVRVVSGLGQGIVMPAVYVLLSHWIPADEKSFSLAVVVVGGNIGPLIAMIVTGFLCKLKFAHGWPLVYYLYGSLTLLLSIIWIMIITDNPETCKFVNENELNRIQSKVETSKYKRTAKTPWMRILLSLPVWAIVIARFTSSWSYYLFMTKLPQFSATILNLSLDENGAISAFTYLAGVLSGIFSGYLADKIEKKRWLSRTCSRKLFESVSQFGMGLSLTCILIPGLHKYLIITLIILSMLFNGLYSGGSGPNMADLAPDYTGSVYGFVTTLAGTPGFLAPLFTGFLLNLHLSQSYTWKVIFFTSGVINAFGALIYLFFASGKIQSWGLRKISNKQRNISVL